MIKIKQGIDNTQLIFYNQRWCGLIIQDLNYKKPIYKALDVTGNELGESMIYGNVLHLILGHRFLK
jgi:hypothetical protein